MPARPSAALAAVLLAAACGGGSPVDAGGPARLRVTVTTSGAGVRPASYLLHVGDRTLTVAANGTSVVALGTVATPVRLRPVALHCTPDWYAPRDVTVAAGDTASLEFTVRCDVPVAAGGLVYSTWTGPASSQHIWRSDGTGGNRVQLTQGDFAASVATVNPGRTRIAHMRISTDHLATLWVMNMDGGEARRFDVAGSVTSLDWSPDGTRILALAQVDASHTVPLVLWADGRSGNPRGDFSEYFHARWSPDGTRLAYRRLNDVYVERLADGLPVALHQALAFGGGGWPAWSPDGNRLAFFDGSLVTVRPDGSDRRTVFTPAVLSGNEVDWSPDGHLLFRAKLPSGYMGLYRIPATGGTPVALVENVRDARWIR